MNELLVEFLQNILERKRSAASLEAEKLGLVSKRFGRWGKEGEKTATHKTDDDGKLVAIEVPSDQPQPSGNRPTKTSSTRTTPFSTEQMFADKVEEFSGTIDNETGAITFDGVQYPRIGKLSTFIKSHFKSEYPDREWSSLDKEERREFIKQAVLIADAINKRHDELKKLMRDKKGNREKVLVVRPDEESQSEYIDNLSSQIGLRDISFDLFEQLKKTSNPEEVTEILTGLLKIAEEHKIPNIPGLAEHFTAIYELKMGRTVIIPTRVDYETVDVVSLSTVGTDLTSTRGLLGQVDAIYSGVSVKRERGAASSPEAKIGKSRFSGYRTPGGVFIPGDEVKRDLLKLTRTTSTREIEGGSEKLRLFISRSDIEKEFKTWIEGEGINASKDEQRNKLREIKEKHRKLREERRLEIEQLIEKHKSVICTYYGVDNCKNMTSAKFIQLLGGGTPDCKGGIPVRKRKPLGRRGDNPTWNYYYAMQGVMVALYNSTVSIQGFSSHSWSKNGIEVGNGLNSFARQQVTSPKESVGAGNYYQPVRHATVNVVVKNKEQLRNGNPCKRN
jgi:hypothetical protein